MRFCVGPCNLEAGTLPGDTESHGKASRSNSLCSTTPHASSQPDIMRFLRNLVDKVRGSHHVMCQIDVTIQSVSQLPANATFVEVLLYRHHMRVLSSEKRVMHGYASFSQTLSFAIDLQQDDKTHSFKQKKCTVSVCDAVTHQAIAAATISFHTFAERSHPVTETLTFANCDKFSSAPAPVMTYSITAKPLDQCDEKSSGSDMSWTVSTSVPCTAVDDDDTESELSEMSDCASQRSQPSEPKCNTAAAAVSIQCTPATPPTAVPMVTPPRAVSASDSSVTSSPRPARFLSLPATAANALPRSAATDMTSVIAKLDYELLEQRLKLKDCVQRQHDAEQSMDQLSIERVDLEAIVGTLKTQQSHLVEDCERLERKVADWRAQISNLQHHSDDLHKAVVPRHEQAKRLRDDIEQMKQERQALADEMAVFKSDLPSTRRQYWLRQGKVALITFTAVAVSQWLW
eukprot:TRINITY_DN12118_c0_g1_i1.p1 TRINITY_DN12118_c0_g1~~TRINITY_DN12118_c0_g1_i1.p1  ORF type:complete len:459 (+),score=99.77 TRINITY_DN12118_c0_g1_i1:1-1377(+)